MPVAPGLYPMQRPRQTKSSGEKAVWKALSTQLPQGWYAWHSMRIRTEEGIHGESDFVIVDPSRGMLVLEVKGGKLTVSQGHWYQNGRLLEETPLAQAHSYVTKLCERIDASREALPVFGVAACFPETEFAQGPKQDDLRGIVLGKQDLLDFGDALRRVFRNALPKRKLDPALGTRWIERLHAMWGETWNAPLSLLHRSRLDDAERVALHEKQLRVLDEIDENERMLVTGEAGTGKTLLALEVARRAAARGQRVLLLCFTDPLAKWLAKECAGSTVQVASVRQYANVLLAKHGRAPATGGDTEAWELAPLQAAMDVEHGDQFDWVVVDEAQDFSGNDWMLVKALAGEGRLWMFRDPRQAFWDNRAIEPELIRSSAKHKLTKVYRNPDLILRLAQAYGGGQDNASPPVKKAVREGVLKVVACANAGAVLQKVKEEIAHLEQAGFGRSDIGVISLQGQTKALIRDQAALDALGAVRADHSHASQRLVADTFLRFKGLERKAIVLVDVAPELSKRDLRMYVALTRALTTVRIVAPSSALQADPWLEQAL